MIFVVMEKVKWKKIEFRQEIRKQYQKTDK